MVYQPAQSSEVVEKSKGKRAIEIVFDVVVMVLVAAATFVFFRLTLIKPENREENNPSVVNKLMTENNETSE